LVVTVLYLIPFQLAKHFKNNPDNFEVVKEAVGWLLGEDREGKQTILPIDSGDSIRILKSYYSCPSQVIVQ